MAEAGGIIWDITKCFCVGAKKEADYIRKLENNLELLKDKWEDVRSIKEDLKTRVDEAENTGQMQRTHEIDRWLTNIDNFQQEITVIQVEGAKLMQDRCLSKYCPKNCKSSYRLGKKVAEMLENVDRLTTGGKRFGENVQVAHTKVPEPLEMPQDEVVGLDLMFNKVWKSIGEENVGIIGLHGMGGVGKTTLLKRINNELGKRKQEFDFVMWVVVSKEPNLDSIMDNIRKLVRIEDDIWNHCSNQDEKAAKIYRVLKQKKFALLLDDMWDEMDLSLVGVPRPRKTNFQSKVLFTTRSENVCAKMQAERTFKVETLTKEESTMLFYMKVGKDTLGSHPSIPKLAEKMAKECKRLPLALVVVGSAMAGVKGVEAWEHSIKNLTSSSLTAPDLEKKVFSVLKFSYDRLDEVQKCCFLYCALYPEDYEIGVLNLIDRWMLEKFLCKDMTKSVQDMQGHGESIIEKLKLLCLLESGKDDLYMDRTVKMHDIIRDMALWIAHDQENMEFMQRVSIMNYWESQKVRDPPNATTVVLLQDNEASCLEDIKYMKRLKVLDIVVRESSFSDIGGLVSLEYLSVSTEILELELLNILQYLTNLRLLSLNVCAGHQFPLGVLSSLQQLRVFRLFNIQFSEERGILEELECLPNIEELCIEIGSKDGLKKLLESTKLQSCIYSLTSGVYNENDEMPLSFASLSEMKQLREFHLTSLKVRREQYSFVFDTGCLTKLRNVTISLCLVTHVTWLKYAPLLQELRISHCESMEEVIKEEEEDCSIKNNENVDSSSSSIFSSLVTLDLLGLPGLESIHKAPLPFPSLRSIEITWCPKLNKLPLDSNSAKHKLVLIKGNEDWWDKLEWDDPAAKHKLQSKFKPGI